MHVSRIRAFPFELVVPDILGAFDLYEADLWTVLKQQGEGAPSNMGSYTSRAQRTDEVHCVSNKDLALLPTPVVPLLLHLYI